METRLEINEFVKRKLLAGNNSSYFSDTVINNAINDNYIILASLKAWPKKEKGFITNTETNQDYYDMPTNCASKSIFKLTIDDLVYQKCNFEDFLIMKDEATSSERYFTEYGRQFFVYPEPTTNTVGNMTVWGVIQAANLTADGDTTMFSYSESQLNQAIGELTYSDLVQPINSGESDKAIARANLIINQTWTPIAARAQRDQMIDRPMFEIIDFFN